MKIKQRPLESNTTIHNDSVLNRIYQARKIKDTGDIDYQLASLLPYTLLKGIDEACALLHTAFKANAKVIIIGDYDVDGATSTSVLASGLQDLGFQNVDFIIPNRLTDGYGLTPKLVDRAADMGAGLIITVDNGIVSYQGVDRANALNIPILITDHHLAAETLPDAVIVNPNQPDCQFPSKCIAGVGVAFYVLIALRAHFRELKLLDKEPNLLKQLDLVALGTVADCVTLDFNNRNMVAQGLKLMRSGKARPGVAALITVAKRSPCLLEADDMGFALAPRLNAAGRLDDMSIGVRCLLSSKKAEALTYAKQLDSINLKRRDMQQEMTESALKYVSSANIENQLIAIIYQSTCHEGIIGLVASMVKERFNIPTVVLTDDEDGNTLKGSCRSIPGVNMRDILADYDRLNPNSLVKFGGHAMAAGLSLKAKDLNTFKETMQKLCSNIIDPSMLQKELWVDGPLPNTHRTIKFARELIDFGPWGNGFEKPLFYDEFEVCEQYIVGQKHLKITLSDGAHMYAGICFNIDTDIWPNHHCQKVKAAYHLQINEFNNKRQMQLMIVSLEAIVSSSKAS